MAESSVSMVLNLGGIVYEFLRVTTHPRIFRTPWSASRAWNFIEAVLASPSLGILIPTERHPEVVAEVMKEVPHLSGNLMYGLQTAVLMREHGIKRNIPETWIFIGFIFWSRLTPSPERCFLSTPGQSKDEFARQTTSPNNQPKGAFSAVCRWEAGSSIEDTANHLTNPTRITVFPRNSLTILIISNTLTAW